MTFSHPPLKRRQIRLLQVLPQSQTTHLVSCRLRPFFLGSSQLPAFTAVSYTWGDPTPKKDTLINGASFKTTDSAYSLLLHGRTGEYLWIDALRIDQSNNDEKATRVLLMGRDIYRRRSSRHLAGAGFGRQHNCRQLHFSTQGRSCKTFGTASGV